MVIMKWFFDSEMTFSVTMILFSNVAYNEMRGIIMGASETIAGVTRCLVLCAHILLW